MYALAFGLLGFLVWSNWEGLKHVLERRIHLDFLLLAAAIAVPSILLTFFRWYILVQAVDLPFTVPNAMRLGMIGYFFNTFLPGSVGGDLIKAAFWRASRAGGQWRWPR